MATIMETVGVLDRAPELERCQFVLTVAAANRAPEQEVVTEDDMADIFGQFVVNLCAHRLRRMLHVFAWPYRMMRVLQGGQAVLDTIA